MSKLLRSDFSFGFELEGLYETLGSSYDEDEVCSMLDKELPSYGDIHGDGSVKRKTITQKPFEYSSGVFKFTPKVLDDVITFLNKLPKMNISVNRSCGFHTHISYKGITSVDIVWWLLNICASGEYKNFLKMKNMCMYNRTYAPYYYLDTAFMLLKFGDFHQAIRTLAKTDKYRVFRIHPQGTLEWRGPRTFLNIPTSKKIKSYIKLLNQVVDSIIKSKEVNVLQ